MVFSLLDLGRSPHAGVPETFDPLPNKLSDPRSANNQSFSDLFKGEALAALQAVTQDQALPFSFRDPRKCQVKKGIVKSTLFRFVRWIDIPKEPLAPFLDAADPAWQRRLRLRHARRHFHGNAASF